MAKNNNPPITEVIEHTAEGLPLAIDERTEMAPDPDRMGRDMTENRQNTDNRARQDAERIRMFRQQHFQVILPNLPALDGYHVCWLTTTNPSDTVAGRLRLGYELIKATEYPEFQHLTTKAVGYEGCIMVNEMLAAKLPLHLYREYMRYAHYEAPKEEDEKIVALLDRVKDEALRHKGRIEEEGGMADFRNPTKREVTFEDSHHGKIK